MNKRETAKDIAEELSAYAEIIKEKFPEIAYNLLIVAAFAAVDRDGSKGSGFLMDNYLSKAGDIMGEFLGKFQEKHIEDLLKP